MQQLEYVRLPEDAGISSKGILNYIAAREAAGLEHHAIWVLRHGKVAAKLAYAPYDDHTPHMLFSLSKSFCSAAAGFAVQEGLLNWDSRLIDVLPEAFPEEPSDWQKMITMHHLLTMGSGLKPESDGGRAEPGWAKAVLAYDCDHEPGTHFAYNSMSTYLVSCMVQKVTGQKIRDYLTPRLFAPLGILKPDGTAPDWDESPDGVNVGGWGLYLKTEDLAKLGQLFLQKGKWNGERVVPAKWIKEATTAHIASRPAGVRPENVKVKPEDSDWLQGYCYQMWRCRHNAVRADGAAGQYIIIMPDQNAVIAVTAQLSNMQREINLIWKHLLPALQ